MYTRVRGKAWFEKRIFFLGAREWPILPLPALLAFYPRILRRNLSAADERGGGEEERASALS